MNVLILVLFFCFGKPISGLPLDYDPDTRLVNLEENTPEPLIAPPVIMMIKNIISQLIDFFNRSISFRISVMME